MSLLDKFEGNFVDNDDDEELDEEEGMEEEGMPASPVNPSAPVPPRSQAVRSSVGRAGVPVRQTSKPTCDTKISSTTRMSCCRAPSRIPPA